MTTENVRNHENIPADYHKLGHRTCQVENKLKQKQRN
jgi:hypothetical protein